MPTYEHPSLFGGMTIDFDQEVYSLRSADQGIKH